MPKQVDHGERRSEIARALLRVVARNGPEAATVREVARESGWSTGVLAHYFADKREMLRFAVAGIRDDFTARIRQLPRPTHTAWVRGVVCELLPLDAHRTDEARAWFSLLPALTADPELASAVRSANRELRRVVAQGLEDARTEGELAFDGTADDVAAQLLALADGLALAHVVDPREHPRRRLVAAADEALAALARRPTDPASR